MSMGSAFRRGGSRRALSGPLVAVYRRLRSIVPLEERGAVLAIMALLLVSLMGVVGFAVDLGWAYWNRLEIQHGADAAALGGVVYAVDDPKRAKEEGLASAASNGYIDTTLGGADTVAIIAYQDDPSSVAHEGQLRATITHEIPTFFIKVFGMNSLTISRTAVAEYVQPLAMGSPEPRFGNDPALGYWPNFWANIHGYYTGKGNGDRYSSQCIRWEMESGCPKNDERRESHDAGSQGAAGGYLYAIEVDPALVGSLLTVELFDPQFTRGGGNDVLVGDQELDDSPGPATTFMLYDPDSTPLRTTDGNTLVCSVTFDPRDPYADFNGDGKANDGDDQDGDGDLDFDDVELAYPGGVAALWETLCTSPIKEAGIYPLRVMVDDPGGNDDRGLNRFSMRASATGGPQPRLYGLGDMSIYANVDGKLGDTEFYLAEVRELHAGKVLVIELWDPGDAAGKHSVEIRDPSGYTPSCTWEAEEHDGSGAKSGSEAHCVIATSKGGGGGKFNNWLLTIRIGLPVDYACDGSHHVGGGDDDSEDDDGGGGDDDGGDDDSGGGGGGGGGDECWWTIHYNYPGKTYDTTTWSARIEGNPVHLVE